MGKIAQYQIHIGFNDSQTRQQLVSPEEFTATISRYLEQNKINFSLSHAGGGYLYGNNQYAVEHTVIITVIGEQLDIIKLSKGLCAFMNQESLLITKIYVDSEYC